MGIDDWADKFCPQPWKNKAQSGIQSVFADFFMVGGFRCFVRKVCSVSWQEILHGGKSLASFRLRKMPRSATAEKGSGEEIPGDPENPCIQKIEYLCRIHPVSLAKRYLVFKSKEIPIFVCCSIISGPGWQFCVAFAEQVKAEKTRTTGRKRKIYFESCYTQ